MNSTGPVESSLIQTLNTSSNGESITKRTLEAITSAMRFTTSCPAREAGNVSSSIPRLPPLRARG